MRASMLLVMQAWKEGCKRLLCFIYKIKQSILSKSPHKAEERKNVRKVKSIQFHDFRKIHHTSKYSTMKS